MNNVATGLVLIPGVVALLIFLVFSYLYEQSRQSYFRAWQLAWAAYTLHYALEAVGHFRGASALLSFLSSLLLLAIAMVMVLAESQRNAIQENALAFSTLGVDPRQLLSAHDLVPTMQSFLDRLVAPLPTHRAIVFISEPWRATLPSVQKGFSPEFVEK